MSSRGPAILRTIAVFGVIVSIVGTVVIWMFLGDLEETSDRSLLIGEQVTESLTETIDVAGDVLTAVDGGLATVQSALTTIDDVMQSVTEVAGAVGSLSSSLPRSLDAIDGALATLQQIATTIDNALATLSSIPFGPDYDPDVPFAEAVAGVREALAPIATDISTVSTELSSFASNSDEMSADLASFAQDIDNTRNALSGADELLAQYRTATVEAGQLAAETRDNLAGSVDRMRLVALALGILLAVSQFVPWTLAGVVEANRRDAPSVAV